MPPKFLNDTEAEDGLFCRVVQDMQANKSNIKFLIVCAGGLPFLHRSLLLILFKRNQRVEEMSVAARRQEALERPR